MPEKRDDLEMSGHNFEAMRKDGMEQTDPQNREDFNYNAIGNVLARTLDRIEDAHKTKLSGLPTGFDELDTLTSGFQPSDFVIIGSRPSVGKTTLALNMAAHIAIRERCPAAFFSLEMPDTAIAQRLISSEALVEGEKMRKGSLTADELGKVNGVAKMMTDVPLFIVDKPAIKIFELRAMARSLRSQKNVQIIFIDYLGLISHENNTMPRHEQMSEISRTLKSLAMELKIPIVVLCQLNREMERSGRNQPPTLANIRDSGSIEQDADLVMFLHQKPPPENEEGEVAKGIPTELIVAKHRNGLTGMIELLMQPKYRRFVPLRQGGLS